MAEDALRAAVHEALCRVAERCGAERQKALGLADEECAQLDKSFGVDRHYWPARKAEGRRRQMVLDLAAGTDPKVIAKKHGVHVATVYRAKSKQEPRQDDTGLGREDWVIR